MLPGHDSGSPGPCEAEDSPCSSLLIQAVHSTPAGPPCPPAFPAVTSRHFPHHHHRSPQLTPATKPPRPTNTGSDAKSSLTMFAFNLSPKGFGFHNSSHNLCKSREIRVLSFPINGFVSWWLQEIKILRQWYNWEQESYLRSSSYNFSLVQIVLLTSCSLSQTPLTIKGLFNLVFLSWHWKWKLYPRVYKACSKDKTCGHYYEYYDCTIFFLPDLPKHTTVPSQIQVN